jgi:hypothetical protein
MDKKKKIKKKNTHSFFGATSQTLNLFGMKLGFGKKKQVKKKPTKKN